MRQPKQMNTRVIISGLESNPSNPFDLANKYEKILSICENHSNIDYYLALCKAYLHKSELDRKPTDAQIFSLQALSSSCIKKY
jgi:hypothetical protein